MTRRPALRAGTHALAFACAVAAMLSAGCDAGGAPAAPAAPAPKSPSATQPSEAAAAAQTATAAPQGGSPSRRMLGRWKMDLATLPDTALTKEMRELKKQGVAAQMRVEYTITDSAFVVDKFGPGGRHHDKWHYEILRESGDNLTLRRIDDKGAPTEIEARLEGGLLIIGSEGGQVPLQRIE